MRFFFLIPAMLIGLSCEIGPQIRASKVRPFSEDLEALEGLASEALGLASPVNVSLSGPCMCGHSWLELSDAAGTEMKYGFYYSRIGDSEGVVFPVISTLDCHSHNAAGDLLPGSNEEMAIQILAGLWLRNQYTEINARLISLNIRQPSGTSEKEILVVRTIGELVDYRDEVLKLAALDKVNERFSEYPNRFWAFRLIMCNGT